MFAVGAGVGHVHAHDQAGRRVGGELDVEPGAAAAVAELDDAGLRVSGRRPRLRRFLLSSLVSFLLFPPQFVAFARRILDPLLTLSGSAFAGRALPSRQFIGVGFREVFERLDLRLRLFQQFLEPAATAERTLAGVGPDPHAVLRDPVHGHQALVHQCGDDLREQFVPLVAVLGAEVGERDS